MIPSLRLSFLPALLLVLILAGCGDSVTPGSTRFTPAGRWRYTATDTLLGTTVRSQLAFNPANGTGTIIDTFSTVGGGDDSIVTVRFEYRAEGEGYQRMVMIHGDSTSAADTSLRYWYFYRHGDTLLYYTGMRYVGNSVSLQGVWENNPADVAILGHHCRLEFGEDSVRIIDTEQEAASTTRVLSYQTSGNSIQIASDSCVDGERFEINPGIALYVTSGLSRRYLPLR